MKLQSVEDEKNFGRAGVISASGIDQALSALSIASSSSSSSSSATADRHPEKRMKAAYKDYEETYLPVLKVENPSLKHSQLKERLWEQWQKAPENPINQARAAEAAAASSSSSADE